MRAQIFRLQISLLAARFSNLHVAGRAKDSSAIFCFHLLIQDGAFICREKKRPFFRKIEGPSSEAIGELLASIIEAVELCLGKRGLLEEDASIETEDDLLSVAAASRTPVEQTISFGERLAQRVRRIGFTRQGELMDFKGPQCVARSGFSLHAARQIHREDRQGLSQLINYMARPPIVEERLGTNAAGDIEYQKAEFVIDFARPFLCRLSAFFSMPKVLQPLACWSRSQP